MTHAQNMTGEAARRNCAHLDDSNAWARAAEWNMFSACVLALIPLNANEKVI